MFCLSVCVHFAPRTNAFSLPRYIVPITSLVRWSFLSLSSAAAGGLWGRRGKGAEDYGAASPSLFVPPPPAYIIRKVEGRGLKGRLVHDVLDLDLPVRTAWGLVLVLLLIGNAPPILLLLLPFCLLLPE